MGEPSCKTFDTAGIEPEPFRKLVKVATKSKVGVLMEADIASTPTGEYVSASEPFQVAERVFTSDGRVFLRLAELFYGDSPGPVGWVSTRSRKDYDKMVLAAVDGSDLESRDLGAV